MMAIACNGKSWSMLKLKTGLALTGGGLSDCSKFHSIKVFQNTMLMLLDFYKLLRCMNATKYSMVF
jgi:hypothetical protein